MLVVMLMAVVLVVELPGALQKCIHDEIQAKTKVVRAADGPRDEPRLRRASTLSGKIAPPAPASPQPIRIRTWIARESNRLSEAEKERLEAAVEEAVRMVSSLLSVERVPGPLLLCRDVNKYCKFLWRNSSTANYNRCGRANSNYRSETCLDVTIPDDHLAGCEVYPEADSPRRTELRPDGAGVSDTDFLLYLHVQATDKCRAEPNVLAYAVHCQTDSRGRPVAGVVVICRDRLSGDTYSHQATVQTVIHELFHALGFSKDLFHTWRDCSSSSSQVGAVCSPRGKVTHSDGSGLMRIYTPSVISELKRHLASTDPELGGPLENLLRAIYFQYIGKNADISTADISSTLHLTPKQYTDVPSGRVSSHWESRVVQGSIMAAALGDWTTVRIDPVTLKALQDTGWYTVDLSRAQSLVWGEGEGAMFGSVSTCQDKSSSFFCTGSGFGCHYLHLHKGQCQTDQYLEGCRVYKPLKNGSECWKEENDRQSAEEENGEIFGFDSRCFFSSLTRQGQTPMTAVHQEFSLVLDSSFTMESWSQILLFSSSVEGRCYRHKCTGPNRYQIQVSGSEWVNCPAGGTIQIQGYKGLVHCPDRRVCVYPDVTPPSNDLSTFPASITSESVTSAQNETCWPVRRPAELTAASVLGVTAAVCLLAAAVVSVRKCCSCRTRIHSAPEHHTDL